MSWMRPIKLFLAMSTMVVSSVVHAHGGGLDENGCHTNRKTGGYHCHRGGGTADVPPRNLFESPEREDSHAVVRPFANCTAARAAGAAPVRRGDPGYGPHLERDNDGVGCEPYRQRQ